MMISCVSPSSEHIEETMMTLNYAKKTMNIVNEPIIRLDGNGGLLVEESQQFQFIKRQNDILIRENKKLRTKIEKRNVLTEEISTKIIENGKQPNNKQEKEKEKEKEKDSREEKESREETDSRDDLLEDYEKKIIELTKNVSQQKRQNNLLVSKMKVLTGIVE